jgi:hypothetical protein
MTGRFHACSTTLRCPFLIIVWCTPDCYMDLFQLLSRAGQVKPKEVESGASQKAAAKEEIKH